MADIFISYSSKDRAQAEQLTELLASAGLSVWIDKQGIDVAASWSGEIVDAIEGCIAFVVLLSPHSVQSHNVIKEVSLASSKKKKILPLDLEPVALTRDLEYPLAGIQRTAMTNIDSIIRALGKLGLTATKAPELKLVKESDERKSLMVMPFEDLSPTRDNDWFTDGIASELLNTLSNVKALKLIDWNTSRELKDKRIRTTTLAREFSVRYFIEGQVRKFGDQIRISITLLDIETGEHLWQDSLNGTMQQIFQIQEECAAKVLAALKLHLTKEEQEQLQKKPTDNAEAYELYLKGQEYYGRATKSDFERALMLYEEAVLLDPTFSLAFAAISDTALSLFRIYGRDPRLLSRAEEAAEWVRELEGESARYCCLMSNISLRHNDAQAAMQYAKRSVELDPSYDPGFDALGSAYKALGMGQEAMEAWKEAVRLWESERNSHFTLLIALHEFGNEQELHKAAERALPIYERHVRLNPDDYHARVRLAGILGWCGRLEDSFAEADKLAAVTSLDGFVCYNLACLYLNQNMRERGISLLQRAIQEGFSDVDLIRHDPDLDPLRGTPEFEKLMKELEEKVAKESNG